MIRGRLKKWVKGDLRDLWWNNYGTIIRNPPMPPQPGSFLFICQGNICRSPFAEHLAKQQLIQGSFGKEEQLFYSAGLEVSTPSPPPEEAVLAARKFGIQINGHRSRGLTREMVESFDMIIAVETWHFRALRRVYPKYRNKVFLLPLFDTRKSEYIKGFFKYNIQDPYGRSLDEFEACFQRIRQCIESLFRQIREAEDEPI